MSKIGLHIMPGPRNGYGPFLKKCADAGQPVRLVKAINDFGALLEAKGYAAQTLTIGRFEELSGAATNGDPVTAAREWFEAFDTKVKALPVNAQAAIDVWECTNELTPPDFGWKWHADFQMVLMDLAGSRYRLALFSFSTGNPPIPALASAERRAAADDALLHISRAAKMAKERGHMLALHEYGGGMLRNATPFHALRYRALAAHLAAQDALCPMVITEAGQNGGGPFVGVEAFIADHAWYDEQLMQDSYLLGCAAWSLGQTVLWQHSNIQDALPALADYIIAHSSPELPQPGAPPVNYVVEVDLFPQNVTLARKLRVVEQLHEKRGTFTHSADDARRLVKPGLPGSKVRIWDAGAWSPSGDPQAIIDYLDVPYELLTFEQPPTPLPPPAAPVIVSVGWRADGGALRSIDAEAIQASHLTGVKFYENSRDDYGRIKAMGIPIANCLKRLSHIKNQRINADGYFTGTGTGRWDLPIAEAYTEGMRWFEPFNEPNLSEEGFGAAWISIVEFCELLNTLLDRIRAKYPDIKLLSPAIGPRDTDPDPSKHTSFWWQAFEAQGVFARCNGHAAHSYWSNRAGMLSPSDGLHFLGLYPYLRGDKRVFITEASNNQSNDSDAEKGAQYVEYINRLDPTKVGRVDFFVVSSSNVGDGQLFNSRRETWVRPGTPADSISVIPGLVGMR